LMMKAPSNCINHFWSSCSQLSSHAFECWCDQL
jgi:hypothetical protein